MNVGLNFLWWLNLNDQVDVGNVKATGGDIGGNKDLKFPFFEALHGDLTLVLRNIAVHDLDVLLNFVTQDKTVGISLSLCEYNCLT
jgi:hypothetical protein